RDRTFQCFFVSRRKSKESKTSPLRISRRVRISLWTSRSSRWEILLASQLLLPRCRSDRITASSMGGHLWFESASDLLPARRQSSRCPCGPDERYVKFAGKAFRRLKRVCQS